MFSFHLRLSGAQRRELENELVEARNAGDMPRINRVLSILALAEGAPVNEATRILRVSRETIRGWFKRYLLEGVRGLRAKKSPGRPAKLTKSQRRKLCQLIDDGPAKAGLAGNCWRSPMIQRLIQERCGIGSALDQSYETRLSFCCAEEECRRCSTPPSVRFLGRKVYLGVMVIPITAMEHGLSPKRRQCLIETLDISPQTLSRWRTWWREAFPGSRCWQEGCFMPPVQTDQLPDNLLGRLDGRDLLQRLSHLLDLLTPITTTSWSGYLRVVIDPQKM